MPQSRTASPVGDDLQGKLDIQSDKLDKLFNVILDQSKNQIGFVIEIYDLIGKQISLLDKIMIENGDIGDEIRQKTEQIKNEHKTIIGKINSLKYNRDEFSDATIPFIPILTKASNYSKRLKAIGERIDTEIKAMSVEAYPIRGLPKNMARAGLTLLTFLVTSIGLLVKFGGGISDWLWLLYFVVASGGGALMYYSYKKWDSDEKDRLKRYIDLFPK